MADDVRRRPKIQAEMLVGVSAVIIGICALGVSLYEASLMREEQRAAIMPLLELTRSHNLQTDESSGEGARLWLQAENVGIGPARVEDFRVTVDGQIARLQSRLCVNDVFWPSPAVHHEAERVTGICRSRHSTTTFPRQHCDVHVF